MILERIALAVPLLALCWLGFRDAEWDGVGLVLAGAAIGVTATLFVIHGIGRRSSHE